MNLTIAPGVWLAAVLLASLKGASSVPVSSGRALATLDLGKSPGLSYSKKVTRAVEEWTRKAAKCDGSLEVWFKNECNELASHYTPSCAANEWLVLEKPKESDRGKPFPVKPKCVPMPCEFPTVWWGPLQKCIDIKDVEEVCGERNTFRTDLFGDVHCDCSPGQGQLTGGEDCYEFYQQGPCEEDEVLVHDPSTALGTCAPDLCYDENQAHARKRRDTENEPKTALEKAIEADLKARAAEEKVRAAALLKAMAIEEEARANEEKARAAELIARAKEEEARAKELKVRAAEEKVREAAFLKAKATEEKARAAEEIARAEELKARQLEEEVRAAAFLRAKATEEKARAMEEKARAAELKVREKEEEIRAAAFLKAKAAEEEARAVEKEARAEEEKARAAELKARAVEEEVRAIALSKAIETEAEARAIEEEARAAELEARANEEKVRAAALSMAIETEEEARTNEQKARLTEEKARTAELRARVVEEKVRASAWSKAKYADEVDKADEEKARATELKARAAEENVRNKELKARLVEDRVRGVQEQTESDSYEMSEITDDVSEAPRKTFAPLNGSGKCLKISSSDGCEKSKKKNTKNIFIVDEETNLPACRGVSTQPPCPNVDPVTNECIGEVNSHG